MIVHVVCNAELEPEMVQKLYCIVPNVYSNMRVCMCVCVQVGVGVKAELECGIQKENDKTIPSFEITDLLVTIATYTCISETEQT